MGVIYRSGVGGIVVWITRLCQASGHGSLMDGTASLAVEKNDIHGHDRLACPFD